MNSAFDFRPPSGAGGGKGGGGDVRAPVEQPDNLHSRQYARVLDLLCEGEIEGLVDGLKSVYLDGVPIENPDGSYNFTGAQVNTVNGTQVQNYIPGFSSAESEKNVSVEVTNAVSVTRTISDSNVDAARITIGIPRLTKQNTTTGDLKGTSVQIAIDLQTNGGGYVEVVNDTITGKTTSRYQRTYRVPLTGSAPYDIRVRRITADSTKSSLINNTWWESYTEIIDHKFSYPNSALAGLEVDSKQFRSIPSRGYDCKLLKVGIPSNYDPLTRTYTGAWDGTFDYAWTDNPAWCFYDLLTNERYGLGAFIDATQVDKWTLYSIAQYCDELVDDGFGGQEPRFTCNIYIQRREEALKLIAAFASIFRGMSYWSSGAVTVSQDKPADPVKLFTKANTDSFNYSGSDVKARHTVALVVWNDPDDAYNEKVEYVEDQTGIALYGFRETEVYAVGCTSQGQAHRVGRWLLYSERLETETVTFPAGMDAAKGIYPGAIIETQDPDRAGVRHGGRIVSATTSSIEIDSTVTISAGVVYTVKAMLPDGTLESSQLNNSPGDTTSLSLVDALSVAPQDNAIWVLTASNLETEKWRTLAVSDNDDNGFDITALEYSPDKFDAVENDLYIEPPITSIFTARPDSPTNLEAVESKYVVAPGVVANRVTLGWAAQLSATYYVVTYKRDEENLVKLVVTDAQADIGPAPAGSYSFTVTAYNAIGAPSAPAALTQTIIGLSDLPDEPQNMTISALGGMALIRWDAFTALDVLVGGHVEFRHSPDLSGASWSGSTSIGDAIPGAETTVLLPLLSGSYLARTRDASGNYSELAASVVSSGATVLEYANVTSITEHTVFTGTHSNTVAIDDVMKLSGDGLVDDIPDIDAVSDWDSYGGIEVAGTYDFSAGIDLGSVSHVRVNKILKALIVNSDDLIDSRTDNIDDWPDFDGVSGNEADATVWVRNTDDNPSGSPVWSDWQRLDSAEFNTRAFDFQARLSSTSVTHNIHVSELGASVDQLV